MFRITSSTSNLVAIRYELSGLMYFIPPEVSYINSDR